MKHMVFYHQVNEYKAGRNKFDKDKVVRTKYQLKVENVLCDRKVPNRINVVAGVLDFENMDFFMRMPE